MEIEISRLGVTFGAIDEGSVFMYQGTYYMRVEDAIRYKLTNCAVDLSSGMIAVFSNTVKVEPVKAKVVIE